MESYQKSLLAALSEALFGQKTEYELQEESYKEAMQQAVLPLLMSVAPNSSYQKENGAILANSIRSFYEHGELHEIMTEAHIPYVGSIERCSIGILLSQSCSTLYGGCGLLCSHG